MKRFRSEREQSTYMLCLFAVFFIVVFFPIMFEYSTAMGLAVHLLVPAAALGAWFAWQRWGRDRFPLRSEKNSP